MTWMQSTKRYQLNCKQKDFYPTLCYSAEKKAACSFLLLTLQDKCVLPETLRRKNKCTSAEHFRRQKSCLCYLHLTSNLLLRGTGWAGQEPGPTAKKRLKWHHSKLSSFQSPWGKQAKVPSRILKVGERSQQYAKPSCKETAGWERPLRELAPGLLAPLKSPFLDDIPPWL